MLPAGYERSSRLKSASGTGGQQGTSAAAAAALGRLAMTGRMHGEHRLHRVSCMVCTGPHAWCAQGLMHAWCAQGLMHAWCAQGLVHAWCAQAAQGLPSSSRTITSPSSHPGRCSLHRAGALDFPPRLTCHDDACHDDACQEHSRPARASSNAAAPPQTSLGHTDSVCTSNARPPYARAHVPHVA